MKNLFLFSFIFWGLSILYAQPCSDLYLSEIVAGKDTSNTITQSVVIDNFALELFNPTNTTIDLSIYHLEIADNNGNMTTIGLNDSILPQETYVIAKSGAMPIITNLADDLTSLLDYNNRTTIKLFKNNTLIDIFGQSGLILPDSIDIVQAIQNPGYYLSLLNIDLSSITGLTIRRNPIVQEDNPYFDSLAYEWTVSYNNDVSDLDHHTGVCMDQVFVVGFKDLLYNVCEPLPPHHPNNAAYVLNTVPTPSASTGNTQVDLYMYIGNTPQGFSTPPFFASFADIGYTSQPSPFFASSPFVLTSPQSYGFVVVQDNIQEPDEHYYLGLQPNAGYPLTSIDPTHQYTEIIIKDCYATVNAEIAQDLSISIFPNPIKEGFLNIIGSDLRKVN